jgi:hypothetical protein
VDARMVAIGNNPGARTIGHAHTCLAGAAVSRMESEATTAWAESTPVVAKLLLAGDASSLRCVALLLLTSWFVSSKWTNSTITHRAENGLEV